MRPRRAVDPNELVVVKQRSDPAVLFCSTTVPLTVATAVAIGICANDMNPIAPSSPYVN